MRPRALRTLAVVAIAIGLLGLFNLLALSPGGVAGVGKAIVFACGMVIGWGAVTFLHAQQQIARDDVARSYRGSTGDDQRRER